MSNKAISRLHRDLVHLRHARKEHEKDVHAFHQDQRARKKDVKEGKKDHKALDNTRKELKHDRAVLERRRTAEQEKLAKLEQQKALLQQQYTDSFDPLTGTGDPGLLMQLGAVDQQEAAVHAKYDPLIAQTKSEVEKGRAKATDLRSQIQADRKEIKSDRRELKHDRKELKHDRNDIKHDRKVALSHLTKAEYHMGLKATNRVRQELGLKKVDHVIRPGVPNVVGGQVGKWIAEAQTILKQHGIPLSKMNARDIAMIIQHESGGNPNAQNNWDSNAAAGHPSIGLMQTIGPTFDSYKLPGHGNIRNPIDNIIAGVRYAISRYGSISNVPGVRAVHNGGAYVGY